MRASPPVAIIPLAASLFACVLPANPEHGGVTPEVIPAPRIQAVQLRFGSNDPTIGDALTYVVRICDPNTCGGSNVAELCVTVTETNSLRLFGRTPTQCGEIQPGERSALAWKVLLERAVEHGEGVERELAKALVEWLGGGDARMVLRALEPAWFAYRERWERKRIEILDQNLYEWGEALRFNCDVADVPLEVFIESLNEEIERWTGRRAVVKYRPAAVRVLVRCVPLRGLSLKEVFRLLVLNEEAVKAGVRIRYAGGEVIVWHESKADDCCELHPEG